MHLTHSTSIFDRKVLSGKPNFVASGELIRYSWLVSILSHLLILYGDSINGELTCIRHCLDEWFSSRIFRNKLFDWYSLRVYIIAAEERSPEYCAINGSVIIKFEISELMVPIIFLVFHECSNHFLDFAVGYFWLAISLRVIFTRWCKLGS